MTLSPKAGGGLLKRPSNFDIDLSNEEFEDDILGGID
jgi:hypothetical protein